MMTDSALLPKVFSPTVIIRDGKVCSQPRRQPNDAASGPFQNNCTACWWAGGVDWRSNGFTDTSKSRACGAYDCQLCHIYHHHHSTPAANAGPGLLNATGDHGACPIASARFCSSSDNKAVTCSNNTLINSLVSKSGKTVQATCFPTLQLDQRDRNNSTPCPSNSDVGACRRQSDLEDKMGCMERPASRQGPLARPRISSPLNSTASQSHSFLCDLLMTKHDYRDQSCHRPDAFQRRPSSPPFSKIGMTWSAESKVFESDSVSPGCGNREKEFAEKVSKHSCPTYRTAPCGFHPAFSWISHHLRLPLADCCCASAVRKRQANSANGQHCNNSALDMTQSSRVNSACHETTAFDDNTPGTYDDFCGGHFCLDSRSRLHSLFTHSAPVCVCGHESKHRGFGSGSESACKRQGPFFPCASQCVRVLQSDSGHPTTGAMRYCGMWTVVKAGTPGPSFTTHVLQTEKDREEKFRRSPSLPDSDRSPGRRGQSDVCMKDLQKSNTFRPQEHKGYGSQHDLSIPAFFPGDFYLNRFSNRNHVWEEPSDMSIKSVEPSEHKHRLSRDAIQGTHHKNTHKIHSICHVAAGAKSQLDEKTIDRNNNRSVEDRQEEQPLSVPRSPPLNCTQRQASPMHSGVPMSGVNPYPASDGNCYIRDKTDNINTKGSEHVSYFEYVPHFSTFAYSSSLTQVNSNHSSPSKTSCKTSPNMTSLRQTRIGFLTEEAKSLHSNDESKTGPVCPSTVKASMLSSFVPGSATTSNIASQLPKPSAKSAGVDVTQPTTDQRHGHYPQTKIFKIPKSKSDIKKEDPVQVPSSDFLPFQEGWKGKNERAMCSEDVASKTGPNKLLAYDIDSDGVSSTDINYASSKCPRYAADFEHVSSTDSNRAAASVPSDRDSELHVPRKKLHSRLRTFPCPMCSVACSNRGQLQGHLRTHTGERPFTCTEPNCRKTFVRNEELTRHRRIHSGERPYPCTVCGKAFSRKDHLNKHRRMHTELDSLPKSDVSK